MHLKLDEKADPRWRLSLEEAGRHVSTLAEEHLRRAADSIIGRTCKYLGLCLLLWTWAFPRSWSTLQTTIRGSLF